LKDSKKAKKSFIVENKKIKTQLVIKQKNCMIVCLANGKGKTHNFKLFKNSLVKLGNLIKVIPD